MARTKNTPKRSKICVFCEYWTGDADLKFISSTVGYEYEHNAIGKCTKKNTNQHTFSSCANYEPSREAKKVL